MKRTTHHFQGSSLLIVLSFVSILTLLVVSILSLVSVDTTISSSFLERNRADNFARYALDEAAEKLSRIPLDKHWAAGPGLLRIWNGSSWDAVNLYSEGTGTDQVDLNARHPDGSYAIMPPNSDFPTAPEMKVNWRYVLANGTVVATAPASGAIGRFAYWVDTENSRANINTAGLGMTEFNSALEPWVANLRGNNGGSGEIVSLTTYQQEVWEKNPWATDSVTVASDGSLSFPALDRSAAQSRTLQNLTGHPSSVDLSFLDGISIQESFNTFRYAGSYFLRADAKNVTLKRPLAGSVPEFWISQNPDLTVRFFNTPEDWKQIVGNDAFERNKAYITTRGRSPEITPWGTQKMSLSLAPKNGNTLNVLSEDLQRNFPDTLIGPDTLNCIEDSRFVLAPNIQPNTTISAGRNLIRDLTTSFNVYLNQTTRPTIQGALSGIQAMLSTPTPGYSSLSSKYGSNGTEQTAVEILSFADQTLNGFSPGFPAYTRFWNEAADPPLVPAVLGSDATKKFYGGRLIPMASASTTRRLATGGPYLLNEIGIQLESTSFSIPQPAVTVAAPAAIVRAASAISEAPYAVLSPMNFNSSTTTSGGPVWCFILRKPLDNTQATAQGGRDRWVRVTIRGELMCPPNWGLSQKLNLGMGPRTYLSDAVLDYSTTDSTYPAGTITGSLRAYFASRRDANTSDSYMLPSSGSYVMAPPAPFGFLSASGPTYVEMFRVSDGGLLIGPFRPGSSVSFTLKLRLISDMQPWGGYLPSAGSVKSIWHAIPGIFQDYDIAGVQPSSNASDRSQEEMLEFRVNNFDVNTIIPQTISYEANDPRLARRKSGWTLSASHSFGAENSNFTGNINNAASDLSMPNSILQTVRGIMRGRAVNGTWGDPSASSERQNASKILGLPGVGALSSIPTGIEANVPWQTMKFHANSDAVPDWLLWNMFFVPFDRSIANQTDGKININSTMHPFGIKRTKPLQALLADRVPNAAGVATNIANRALAGGASALAGPSDLYIYGGQVAQISGVADSGANEYEKEKVTRGIADIVTTQCSDYRVFIVAQSIRQNAQGTITPLVTRRVEATLSRSFDEGGRFYTPTGFGQSYAGRGYPFVSTGAPAAFFPSSVVERSSYLANPNTPSALNLNDTATITSKGRNFLGADGIPNTGDDWLVPQKIEVSSFRNLQ
jgi:hypothetical protein